MSIEDMNPQKELEITFMRELRDRHSWYRGAKCYSILINCYTCLGVCSSFLPLTNILECATVLKKWWKLILLGIKMFHVERCMMNCKGAIPLTCSKRQSLLHRVLTISMTSHSHPIFIIYYFSPFTANKLPSISDKLSTPAIIGVILGAFFFLLILVDISCYCMNNCGFLMCICVHCCGKTPPDEKDDLEMGDGPPGYGWVIFLYLSKYVFLGGKQILLYICQCWSKSAWRLNW